MYTRKTNEETKAKKKKNLIVKYVIICKILMFYRIFVPK